MTHRTRFAPSPTGDLHIGSARVALYCWLYAKHALGKSILRVEDTDRERSTNEAIEVIHQSLAWLGLHFDEGPFYQTERMPRYIEMVQQLLESGKAYRCYCSKERLEELRKTQMQNKQKPKYDGKCREVQGDLNTPHVIRFKNPLDGFVTFEDVVRGSISISNAELDDLIIMRSDGNPTYNFTVVIDDLDMQVTEVIRGEDHINNTPRQINLFKAFGVEPPRYAHLPMILGEDGKKLSKRHGAVSVMHYRDLGFLPEALLNYLVRLGWSHGDQEIFSIDEMIKYFDLSHITHSAATFDTEKLKWLNQHYIKTLPAEKVVKELKWHFEQLGVDIEPGPSLEALLEVQQERCKTLRELAEQSQFFYQSEITLEQQQAKKLLRPVILEPLQALCQRLADLVEWRPQLLHEAVHHIAEQFELKLGKLAQPVRFATTGGTSSPSLDATLHLIGRDKVLARLNQALDYIRQRAENNPV